MGFESNPFLSPSPERPVQEEYRYVAKDGTEIGRATAVFLPETKEIKKAGAHVRGRELCSFNISGPDGSVDLVAMARAQDVKIIISHERMKREWFYAKEKIIGVSPLETALNIAILGHELGHSAQMKEDAFRALSELYLTVDAQHVHPAPKGRLKGEVLEEILQKVPDLRETVEEDIGAKIQKMNELELRFRRERDVEEGCERAVDEARQNRARVLKGTFLEMLSFSSDDLEALLDGETDTKEGRRNVLDRLDAMGFRFGSAVSTPIEGTSALREDEICDSPFIAQCIEDIISSVVLRKGYYLYDSLGGDSAYFSCDVSGWNAECGS